MQVLNSQWFKFKIKHDVITQELCDIWYVYLCLWKKRVVIHTAPIPIPINSAAWKAQGMNGTLSRKMSGSGGYFSTSGTRSWTMTMMKAVIRKTVKTYIKLRTVFQISGSRWWEWCIFTFRVMKSCVPVNSSSSDEFSVLPSSLLSEPKTSLRRAVIWNINFLMSPRTESCSGGCFRSFSVKDNRTCPSILWVSQKVSAYCGNPLFFIHSLTFWQFQFFTLAVFILDL